MLKFFCVFRLSFKVTDVFATRISKRSLQGCKNVVGVRRGNEYDLAERKPEPPNRRRSSYRVLSAGFLLLL